MAYIPQKDSDTVAFQKISKMPRFLRERQKNYTPKGDQ